jgi:hypothetical protein
MSTARLVALSAVAFVVLNNVIASALVLAAYGFDPSLLLADGELVTRQLGTAELLRWGALIDMVGYLSIAPVVLYMYSKGPRRVGGWVTAFSGLSFAVVGAIGAVLLASVGASLLQSPASDEVSLAAARVAYSGLENAVFVGLWGTLELLLLGVWFGGVARQLLPDSRAFGYVAVLAGIGCVGYAIRTGLTGHPPLPVAGPIDIAILACVAFLPIWMLWLAVMLWRGAGGQRQ